MNQTHKLDKAKVEAELRERGWTRNEYGMWQTPLGTDDKKAALDWTECILEGIICEHEEKIEENKAFLDSHPTQKREM